MTFGSWNDGLFQLPLQDERTPASVSVRACRTKRERAISTHQMQDPPGTHLAGGNEQPTEGAFIYKPQGSPFFFQFFSNGHTPTVNVRFSLAHLAPAPFAHNAVPRRIRIPARRRETSTRCSSAGARACRART